MIIMTPLLGDIHWETINIQQSLASVAERLRRRLCNQKIAGSNPASGHLATPFKRRS